MSGSCGVASDYGCTACNNGAGVGTEYYTGPASTIGQSNCPVSACSACPAGQVIGTACSATSNTMCVACGSNEYESGGDCVACRVTCGSGEYVSGSCGGASDYGCTACNNGAGVGSEYYTGPASTIGQSNCPVSACSACPAGQVIGTACSATSNTMCVACGSNEYESGGDCVACRVTCGSGEYVSGSCGGASDYGCTACNNGAGVGTEYYTGPASTIGQSNCPVSACSACPSGQVIGTACSATSNTMCVACGSNEYESGGDCVACRVTCGIGEYVSGNCGGASDYGCTACDNGAGVGSEYYTGPASTIGQSNCPVSACSACPAGQVIGTACSASSNTMCVACGSNEYESGGDCVACRVTCGSGEYVSGSCGGASDYGCTACNNGAGVGTEYYTGPASTIGQSNCPVSACSSVSFGSRSLSTAV